MQRQRTSWTGELDGESYLWHEFHVKASKKSVMSKRQRSVMSRRQRSLLSCMRAVNDRVRDIWERRGTHDCCFSVAANCASGSADNSVWRSPELCWTLLPDWVGARFGRPCGWRTYGFCFLGSRQGRIWIGRQSCVAFVVSPVGLIARL